MPSKSTKQVTKSVRFSAEENALIEQVSQREYLPEGTLLRKLVLEGLARYRLEEAIADYEAGDRNLGQAARRARPRLRDDAPRASALRSAATREARLRPPAGR